MKNKNFIGSLRCAFNGLFLALEKERNFKVYIVNVLVSLLVNILLCFSTTQFLIWGITIAGVFSAECINSCIERLCDFITKEKHDEIGYIKDVAAGAVLCWGIIFYVAEFVMIGVNIVAL